LIAIYTKRGGTMITAERKPLKEILEYIEPYDQILLVGCNECVTVCAAGGRKEVGLLSSALQMACMKSGKTLEVREITLERQCDPEYIEELVNHMDQADAVLSMACGCGVQEVARRFKDTPVFPDVNTEFMGASERQGVWAERCQGCGDCLLGLTGGICPIARCSKRLLNGPCGGSTNGKCEISSEVECAWQLIWDRLRALGTEDRYEEIMSAKDWRASRDGGPRRIIREDLAS
jgi:ferredoxin